MHRVVLSICSFAASVFPALPPFVVDAETSHGFAWEDGADVDAYILPLYHYVKNVNRTDDGGGYYGK